MKGKSRLQQRQANLHYITRQTERKCYGKVTVTKLYLCAHFNHYSFSTKSSSQLPTISQNNLVYSTSYTWVCSCIQTSWSHENEL